MNETTTLIMYGAMWCPAVVRARRYLKRHDIAYDYRDIDQDPEAKAELLALSGPGWVVPTYVLPDEEKTVLANPSLRQLAALLEQEGE